jgi:thiosulfate dehydrogenase
MKIIRTSWFPLLLGLIILVIILSQTFTSTETIDNATTLPRTYSETEEWLAPDTSEIPFNEEGYLIQYGRELIVNTALYLGPKGIISRQSNGMNCQNCHLDAGARLYANTFSAVASTYPKHRDRSGKLETIEFRINECMERSMNGLALDSNSKEMRAMVAYLKWMGKGVPIGIKPKGAATEELPYLNRPADLVKGKEIFLLKCQRCHNSNGEGVYSEDSSFFVYPPLWGPNSYNVSAGMYRLSRLAGFIKNNMPFGATWKEPQLTNEEAWDVAAFINSQPRPEKFFPYDWPNIAKKPVDHPFGPFADSFSEQQHKYGPFEEIVKARKISNETKVRNQ